MDTHETLTKLKQPLDISDIDFRVQSITPKGYACIVSYKDARVDMNRLDNVCGANWQNKYDLIDGNLHCGIAIKIDGEWIWRWDVGVESNTEKIKGEASDAFKRAATRWGIGRELYNHPKIFIQLNSDEFILEGNRARQTWNLKLDQWQWFVKYDNNSNVIEMQGIDTRGNVRYRYTPKQSAEAKSAPPQNHKPKKQPPVEKPWLIKMTGNDMTKEWHNVVTGITVRKSITSIDQVKNWYKISQSIEQELTVMLQQNGSYQASAANT